MSADLLCGGEKMNGRASGYNELINPPATSWCRSVLVEFDLYQTLKVDRSSGLDETQALLNVSSAEWINSLSRNLFRHRRFALIVVKRKVIVAQ